MKLRVRLRRYSVLAGVFCRADEGVAAARGRLVEAQAERRRVLAALAVTVGSDVATARLVGLSDREVRSARRSVGNRVARSLAREVLDRSSGEGGGEGMPSGVPVVERDPWAGSWLPSEDEVLLGAWSETGSVSAGVDEPGAPGSGRHRRLHVVHPDRGEMGGPGYPMYDATGA